jgi:hypothetical protein
MFIFKLKISNWSEHRTLPKSLSEMKGTENKRIHDSDPSKLNDCN